MPLVDRGAFFLFVITLLETAFIATLLLVWLAQHQALAHIAEVHVA